MINALCVGISPPLYPTKDLNIETPLTVFAQELIPCSPARRGERLKAARLRWALAIAMVIAPFQGLNLFLQLDLFFVFIKEMIFGQVVVGIFFNPDFLPVFPAPFPLF